MKTLEIKEEIFDGEKEGHLYYEASRGVLVHDVVIEAGLGKEISIGHISDLHYNYCDQYDLEEADPVLMSTLEHRRWLKDGASVPRGRNCYDLLDDMDLMVFNGDMMDYLSHGTMELMQREVWDRFPDAIATVGGHELSRRVQGELEETMTYDERMARIKAFWKHDVYYTSKPVGNKVLVIGLFNDHWTLNADQHQRLKKDLALARQKGYVVLLFMHEPICTGNPADAWVTAESPCVLKTGDVSGFPKNLCHGDTRGFPIIGGEGCDEITNAVYAEIVNSADVIRGVFAGHWHNEVVLDIMAKTPDGASATIPQYVKTASAYGEGVVMRILIK